MICQTYADDLIHAHQSAMTLHLKNGLSESTPPSLQDAPPILHELWAPFCHAHAHLYSLPTAQQYDCISTFKTTKNLPPLHDSFHQLNHELQRLYDQRPIAIKFKSRQFNIPKRLCWNELMSHCFQVLNNAHSTTAPTIPLNSNALLLFNSRLIRMMKKLNHTITNEPDRQLLPSHIRSGLR